MTNMYGSTGDDVLFMSCYRIPSICVGDTGQSDSLDDWLDDMLAS